jgi:hypothetical protein
LSPYKKAGEKTTEDELSREINEMLGLIDKLPLVRHLILGYFQELKLNYHEIIQQELAEKSEDTDKKSKKKKASISSLSFISTAVWLSIPIKKKGQCKKKIFFLKPTVFFYTIWLY